MKTKPSCVKEEQNASSSANYDVELFHAASSHRRLLGDFADMIMASSEGSEYQGACQFKKTNFPPNQDFFPLRNKEKKTCFLIGSLH